MPPASLNPAPLPTPSTEEQAVSDRLAAVIRAEIERAGSIPFSRFMDLALYAPGFGYYTSGKPKFGAQGDFITAPESFPLFGRCLAHAIHEMLAPLAPADILEVGAGSGRLAAGVLRELGALGVLPRHYYILELSAELRERQTMTLRQEAPQHCERVRWLEALPDPGFRGVVLANELLDAMPVERFRVETDGVSQLRVDWREGSFAWRTASASDAIVERIAPLDLPAGYVSEIGFAAEAWVRTMAEQLAAGVLLLIDYGYPRTEYYHPDRSSGTLMCHYRHRAHSDPLILPGLQDITAHIDFSAVAQAGVSGGLDVLGYTSQAAFLFGSGLDAIINSSDPRDVRAHLALTEQVKKLTLPHEMGELFKVMALGREKQLRLGCFAWQDRRQRL